MKKSFKKLINCCLPVALVGAAGCTLFATSCTDNAKANAFDIEYSDPNNMDFGNITSSNYVSGGDISYDKELINLGGYKYSLYEVKEDGRYPLNLDWLSVKFNNDGEKGVKIEILNNGGSDKSYPDVELDVWAYSKTEKFESNTLTFSFTINCSADVTVSYSGSKTPAGNLSHYDTEYDFNGTISVSRYSQIGEWKVELSPKKDNDYDGECTITIINNKTIHLSTSGQTWPVGDLSFNFDVCLFCKNGKTQSISGFSFTLHC